MVGKVGANPDIWYLFTITGFYHNRLARLGVRWWVFVGCDHPRSHPWHGTPSANSVCGNRHAVWLGLEAVAHDGGAGGAICLPPAAAIAAIFGGDAAGIDCNQPLR